MLLLMELVQKGRQEHSPTYCELEMGGVLECTKYV